MIITAEQVKEIIRDASEEFEIVEKSDWISEGKYEYRDYIFKSGDKFFELSVSRSGSHFTDWYYCWEDQTEFECSEVEKFEVLKTVWKVKKQ